MATATKKNALVKWDEKFANLAKKEKAQAATISTSGTSVKFGRGWIEVGGQRVKGGKLECVIVGYCGLNAWYEKDYDANDKAPPDCYALADSWNDPTMKPHQLSAKPQHEDCATCRWNKLGSAKTGRGKACANRARIGILLSSDLKDASAIVNLELAGGSISPTNVYKSFKPYMDSVIDEMERPLWSVITQIESFDDPVQQIRLEFSMVEEINDNDALTALEKRNEKIQSVLQQPFAQIEKAPVKPAGKQKFAGKVNGRRK